MNLAHFDPAKLDPQIRRDRRIRVATLLLALTAPAVMVMADLHYRTGFDLVKVLHLAIFTLLFTLVALGSVQAIIGLAIRRRGEPFAIGNTVDFATDTEALEAPTAVVMPI